MATLIAIVLFGSIIAYFATQNTDYVSITFQNYTVKHIPLYAVIVVSLLVGLVLAWIINLINSISSSFTIHGKENKIKESKKQIAELTKKIHQLELENTKLKTELKEPIDIDDKSL